jgi:hypothetical protein
MSFQMNEIATYIEPVVHLRQHSYPAPISLWGGLHAPGVNIREAYAESQGRPKVREFNAKVADLIEEQAGSVRLEEGGMRQIQFYNVSLRFVPRYFERVSADLRWLAGH